MSVKVPGTQRTRSKWFFSGMPFTFAEDSIFINYKHTLATSTRSGMGKQTRSPGFFENPFEAGKHGFEPHQAVDGSGM